MMNPAYEPTEEDGEDEDLPPIPRRDYDDDTNPPHPHFLPEGPQPPPTGTHPNEPTDPTDPIDPTDPLDPSVHLPPGTEPLFGPPGGEDEEMLYEAMGDPADPPPRPKSHHVGFNLPGRQPSVTESQDGAKTPLLSEHGSQPGEPVDDVKKKKSWDAFSPNAAEDFDSSDRFYDAGKKCLKVFLYVFLFCLTLVGVAIHAATLLYAASNMHDPGPQPGYPLVCLDYKHWINASANKYENITNCVLLPEAMVNLTTGNDWLTELPCLITHDEDDITFAAVNSIQARGGESLIPIQAPGDSIQAPGGGSFVPIQALGGGSLIPIQAFGDSIQALADTSSQAPDDTSAQPATTTTTPPPAQPSEPYPARMCHVTASLWVWCLLLIQCTPYVFKLIRCLWYIAFKTLKGPSWDTVIFVCCFEILPSLGTSMFLFIVLPLLNDILAGCILLPAISFLPSLINIFNRPKKERLVTLKLMFDILACLGQLSAMVAWPVLIGLGVGRWAGAPFELVWAIPLSLFLISLGWWENYVGKHTRLGRLGNSLLEMKKKTHKCRTKLMAIVFVWKIGLSIAFMCVWVVIGSGAGTNNHYPSLDEVFNVQFSDCKTTGGSGFWPEIGTAKIKHMDLDLLWVWLINVLCGLFAYFSARAAAKAQLQKFSYALPLHLVSPVVLAFLIGMCEMWKKNPCEYSGDLPTYAFFKCYSNDILTVIVDEQLYMFFVWWMSHLWIGRHIWFPKNSRLAKTDKIFLNPLYDGIFVEQSLVHNRNREDEPKASNKQMAFIPQEQRASIAEEVATASQEVPMIYFCATMWHETPEEMINMLKSIFKMDRDQAARRNAQEFFKFKDKDFYRFEAHIFFDDAMGKHSLKGGDEYRVNDYVKDLVKTINTAGGLIHRNENFACKPPTRYATPYGGRLEWALPGGNKLVAHLKDKIKIRHKKRWSQVMYMYYFLAHRLVDKEGSWKKKQLEAENTFLLALDGDVDFEPIAVTLLVDLMKRNLKVGAACGRIHPIGSGPMVWYQSFEYALGHWMQKATEHVIGCVLCSPGCFSLFRGSALMDDKVMATYTTKATEARHYVQYDQGEDRWLCTLLLQQGYRVEYCAASDALTQAPEEFKEFYNQRRRWGPSTMANVYDLLMSWRSTTKKNQDISFLYIIYQATMLFLSLLGPGTIFLMIVGAVEVALSGRVSMWTSFVLNLIPITIFVVMCFFTKCDTQVAFAFILSGLYAILQMIVLVGVCIQMSEQGPCSPPFIFFFYVAGTFILAAILHPQEIFCVVHGFTYFLAIPSMYMLLIIYGMCNLNNVSWGTREVVPTKTELEMEAEQEQKQKFEEEKKKGGDSDSSWFGMFNMMSGSGNQEEGFTCRIGDICKWVWCPTAKPPPTEDKMLLRISKQIEDLEDSLKGVEESIQEIKTGPAPEEDEAPPDPEGNWTMEKQKSIKRTHPPLLGETTTDNPMFREEVPAAAKVATEVKAKRDEMVNPFWIEDEDLGRGPVGKLNDSETAFFFELIKEYLEPLDEDKITQEKIANALTDLKNKAAGAFLMLNAIFVVTISVLQLNMDTLAVPWPCGDNLRLEPIGFMFLICFVSVMILQTFGMIVHRTGNLLHTASTTVLKCEQKVWQSEDKVQLMFEQSVKNIINQTTDMCTLKDDSNEDATSIATSVASEGEEVKPKHMRKTLKKIEKQRTNTQKRKPTVRFSTVDAAFRANFEKLASQDVPTKMNKRLRSTRKSLKEFQAMRDQMEGQQNGGLGVANWLEHNNPDTQSIEDATSSDSSPDGPLDIPAGRNRCATLDSIDETGPGAVALHVIDETAEEPTDLYDDVQLPDEQECRL